MAVHKLKALKSVRDLGQEDGISGKIGPQVKSIRRERNLTLDELAELTGLNKGYLSRIERGEKSPSVATVLKIAQALKAPVANLFGEQIDDSAIRVVPAKARKMVKPKAGQGSYPFATLSKPGQNTKIASFFMIPSLDFGPEGHGNHDGEEVLFVLKGRIEVGFADRSVALSQGDYLQFPGHLKHRVRSIGSAAEILIVIALD